MNEQTRQPAITRRDWLTLGGTALVAAQGLAIGRADDEPKSPPADPFAYCFNTSTIRGQKLGIGEQIDLAAAAGYDGIEPWIRDIVTYQESGKPLRDLRRRISDHGLKVFSAIGFSQWIVNDSATRSRALEQAKREMDILKQIGGTHIAAPPAGATRQTDVSLPAAANRYAKLCEIGSELGVVPQVEVWGFSATLSRLGEAIYVAVESGHPNACVLPDVYHLYKGGSDFEGLKLLGPRAMSAFHINDYPNPPTREEIGDADRVYPGDGVAPLAKIIQTLYQIGFRGALSLELFNPEYWKQDAEVVAKTGLEKSRSAVRTALQSVD